MHDLCCCTAGMQSLRVEQLMQTRLLCCCLAAVLQAVYEWNKQAPVKGQVQSMRVLLGGSEVLNSDMFLKALGAA